MVVTILLLLMTFAFLFIGLIQLDSEPVFYTSLEDDTIFLKRENLKYFLGDIELERVDTPWQEDVKSALPFIPYALGGVFCLILWVRYMSQLPPVFMWPKILGIEGKLKNQDTKISLREAPGGLIAVRGWTMDKTGCLRSIAKGTNWETTELNADAVPKTGGWRGIYAYRLGTNIDDYDAKVLGVVSLSGHLVAHKDSMIRAQKCTILLLVTKKENIASRLEERYKCPVFIVNNPRKALENWVISLEGIFWLAHNNKLITHQRLKETLEYNITELPAYQQFKTDGGVM